MKTHSVKRNITILVSLMKAWGIKDVVVCPGSRNAPIVHTLADADSFVCHPVTDERSASFVALGMIDALKRPVAVCCTSGSALLNMAPGVAEAYYRHVPLLVVSADRPKEWIGQMDGQTLNQIGCFGPHAKTYSIEETKDETDEWFVNRTVNEALMSLSLEGGCPVHINVGLREPLFDFSDSVVADERVIEWEKNAELSEAAINELNQAGKVMLVVGQMVTNMTDDRRQRIHQAIEELIGKGCVVVAEHLSNLTNRDVCRRFDDVLANDESDELSPDLLIYLGEHIVSKRLKHFFRKRKHTICWHVTEGDCIVDLFQCVSRMVKRDALSFVEELTGKIPQKNTEYSSRWHRAELSLKTINVNVWNDATAVGIVLSKMPSGGALALANSSTVRHAQHFELPDNTEVICNRGVNGIEGSLSAAVGYAMASDRITTCIIGDLSFFYDMNALWNVELPSNLRVIILNNSGGLIFGTLKGLEKSDSRWRYVAASHGQTAEGWVKSVGAEYRSVKNKDDFADEHNGLATFWEDSRKPIVIEVFSEKCGD